MNTAKRTFMHGPAAATKRWAVRMWSLRVMAEGWTITGLPQPKPMEPLKMSMKSGSAMVPMGSAWTSGLSVTRPCRR
jgi:hypothetical protein